MVNSAVLTELDKRILAYIRNNPGKSKEDVVKGMNGNPTRIPVLNHLQCLIDEKIIVARKDKPNSMIYRLYLNPENVKSSLFEELLLFKKSYIELLEGSKMVFDEYESKIRDTPKKSHWPFVRKILKNEYELLHEFFSIYTFMVKIYGIVRIVQWHRTISDPEQISELYSMAFNTLEEIQRKIYDFLKTLYIYGTYKDSEMFSQMFSHGDVPDLKFFFNLYDTFHRYDLEKEFEPLMDMLWKISSELIPFQHYRSVLNLKNIDRRDWKSILIDYGAKFGHGRQSWME